MQIEIVRPDGDLKREVWVFTLYVDCERSIMFFSFYAVETRRTSRCRNWNKQGLWDRSDQRSYHSTIAEPPLPADVEADARQRFAEAIGKLPITR